MRFGITNLSNGWFYWFLQDDIEKVEFIASRYDDVDFVKLLLRNLTDIIRNRKTNSFSFFSEPGFVTIKMKPENNDMFTIEIAYNDRAINLNENMKCSSKYYSFTVTMFCIRTEFVPSIIKVFKEFEKSSDKLDYYIENWSEALGIQDRDIFEYPFKELQELNKTASDIRIK